MFKGSIFLKYVANIYLLFRLKVYGRSSSARGRAAATRRWSATSSSSTSAPSTSGTRRPSRRTTRTRRSSTTRSSRFPRSRMRISPRTAWWSRRGTWRIGRWSGKPAPVSQMPAASSAPTHLPAYCPPPRPHTPSRPSSQTTATWPAPLTRTQSILPIDQVCHILFIMNNYFTGIPGKVYF